VTDAYIGEIQLFAFPFAPVNWAACNGQLIPIQQNTALFSLIGTFYGGNGTSTFALPNLNGFSPCSAGQGPGLSAHDIGEVFGEAQVGLTLTQMPGHTHLTTLYTQPDTSKRVGAPKTGYGVVTPGSATVFTSTTPGVAFAANTIGLTGENVAHANQQPYLVLNFCICLRGIFPQFS
jgi:microcystin-dependent protein